MRIWKAKTCEYETLWAFKYFYLAAFKDIEMYRNIYSVMHR